MLSISLSLRLTLLMPRSVMNFCTSATVTMEAVLAARLAGTVYKTLSKDDQYEAARNETILSIAQWIMDNPSATQVKYQK